MPHHGSLSSGGSPPYGVSPLGVPPFGATKLPAFGATTGAVGELHLGLSNGLP